MISLFENVEQCYGCGVCGNICPKKAITIKQDIKGFYYPKIEDELCINCGLCKKVCQIGNETQQLKLRSEKCFAVKADNEIRTTSSSGGIFTIVSQYVLNSGGICVGVKFDRDFNAVFDVADNFEKCKEFRGSKYIQANTNDIFKKVEKYLKEERMVLFTGTPCQVNALYLYLKTIKANTKLLLTIDLVCHGVPSPIVWKDFISELQNLNGSELTNFTFRDKNKGWRGYHICAKFKNSSIVHDNDFTQSYVKLFSKDLMLRSSCYRCSYASLYRTADITIGDFWGIENIDIDFSDNMGISLVIPNTDKGKDVFEKINQNFVFKEYETKLLTQHNLYSPTTKSCYYDRFWKLFLKKGYLKVAKKFGGYGKYQLLYKIRDFIDYRILKRK